jgi:hypothetical protein
MTDRETDLFASMYRLKEARRLLMETAKVVAGDIMLHQLIMGQVAMNDQAQEEVAKVLSKAMLEAREQEKPFVSSIPEQCPVTDAGPQGVNMRCIHEKGHVGPHDLRPDEPLPSA